MGVGAAPLFVFLIANTDRRDRIRLWSLALLAGIFWGPVFKGAESLVGSHFDQRAAGDAEEIAGETKARDLPGLRRWLGALATPLEDVSQIELRQQVLRDAGQTLHTALQAGQVQLTADEWHTLAEAHPEVMLSPVFYEQFPEPAWLEPTSSELAAYVLRDSNLREQVFDEELLKRTDDAFDPGAFWMPASAGGAPWRGLPRNASVEVDSSGDGLLIEPPPGAEWELLDSGRLRLRPGTGEARVETGRNGADLRLDVLRAEALERVTRRGLEIPGGS